MRGYVAVLRQCEKVIHEEEDKAQCVAIIDKLVALFAVWILPQFPLELGRSHFPFYVPISAWSHRIEEA